MKVVFSFFMIVKLTIRNLLKNFDIIGFVNKEENTNPSKSSVEIKLAEGLDEIGTKIDAELGSTHAVLKLISIEQIREDKHHC